MLLHPANVLLANSNLIHPARYKCNFLFHSRFSAAALSPDCQTDEQDPEQRDIAEPAGKRKFEGGQVSGLDK